MVRIVAVEEARASGLRRRVSPSAMAPAASVGPSLPSVPALKTTTSGKTGDVDGGGQDELLVAAAEAVAFAA